MGIFKGILSLLHRQAVEKNIRMKVVVAFLMVCIIMVVAGQDHLLRQSRSTLDEAEGGNDGWQTRLGRTNNEEGGNDGWQTRLGRINTEGNRDDKLLLRTS